MLLRWTSVVCFFCSASHEPRPRGDPDSCAPAFPAIPHHPLPGSISVGSLHTYYNASHCPCGAATAATPLEGKRAYGQRTWEICLWMKRFEESWRILTNFLLQPIKTSRPPPSVCWPIRRWSTHRPDERFRRASSPLPSSSCWSTAVWAPPSLPSTTQTKEEWGGTQSSSEQ